MLINEKAPIVMQVLEISDPLASKVSPDKTVRTLLTPTIFVRRFVCCLLKIFITKIRCSVTDTEAMIICRKSSVG